jgi:hypothetical protein
MTNTRLLRLAGPIGLGVVLVASLAAATVGSSPYDPDTGAPVLAPVTDQLSAEASAQMKALGPSVHVVECAPGLSKLPAGLRPSRPLGFAATHPGFVVLSDGHCAMDTDQPGRIQESESAD